MSSGQHTEHLDLHTMRGLSASSIARWAAGIGLASAACSGGADAPLGPWPAGCDVCTTILTDGSLKPAAIASDDGFVYVLKVQTSEIVKVSLATKQNVVLSDAVPHATGLFRRNQLLWVTAHDPSKDSLWTVDSATGDVTALPELAGLTAVALGPGNTPVAALQENGRLRVVSLSEDGTIGRVLWELNVPGAYFFDFAASQEGVAWIASTITSGTLYLASEPASTPLSASTRPGTPQRGSLVIAEGTAAVLESTETGGISLFILDGGQLAEQAQLSGQAFGLRTLGASLLETSLDGRVVRVLDTTGAVLVSRSLAAPLNIPAVADERFIYLPFANALAFFPRTGRWL